MDIITIISKQKITHTSRKMRFYISSMRLCKSVPHMMLMQVMQKVHDFLYWLKNRCKKYTYIGYKHNRCKGKFKRSKQKETYNIGLGCKLQLM